MPNRGKADYARENVLPLNRPTYRLPLTRLTLERDPSVSDVENFIVSMQPTAHRLAQETREPADHNLNLKRSTSPVTMISSSAFPLMWMTPACRSW